MSTEGDIPDRIDPCYLDVDGRLQYGYFTAQIGSQGITNEDWCDRRDELLKTKLPYFLPVSRNCFDLQLYRHFEDALMGAWREGTYGDDRAWGVRFELEEDAVFVRLLLSGMA
jgi:hypothetical protein